MKHNFMTKMVSALLAVVLSTAAFSVTAFASGGEESTESVAEQETAGDVSDLLSALAGSQVTVSVTEDGIQFSSGENDSGPVSYTHLTKYLTLTIEARDSKTARARFSRIVMDALNHFKVMGALAKELGGKEWLEMLHGILHSDRCV